MYDFRMSTPVVESVLTEQRSFPPAPAFAATARVRPDDLAVLHAEAAADPQAFWAGLARAEIAWRKPFTEVLDESRAPNYRWFADGELNVSWNCLDVHLADRGDKTAIVFEGEPGDVRTLSYRELHAAPDTTAFVRRPVHPRTRSRSCRRGRPSARRDNSTKRSARHRRTSDSSAPATRRAPR